VKICEAFGFEIPEGCSPEYVISFDREIDIDLHCFSSLNSLYFFSVNRKFLQHFYNALFNALFNTEVF